MRTIRTDINPWVSAPKMATNRTLHYTSSAVINGCMRQPNLEQDWTVKPLDSHRKTTTVMEQTLWCLDPPKIYEAS